MKETNRWFCSKYKRNNRRRVLQLRTKGEPRLAATTLISTHDGYYITQNLIKLLYFLTCKIIITNELTN